MTCRNVRSLFNLAQSLEMCETLLIINADDLGATVPVNDAIFALMDQGLVTSATIMANADGFQDATRRLKEHPDCSFGVHLNLTAFRPLRPTPGLAPLLNSSGCMSRFAGGVRWTPRLLFAVYAEWCAQVERCLDAGIRVSHFDAHHHMHTLPWLFPVLKALQLRYGISRVRGTINILPAASMEGLRASKKSLYRHLMKAIVATRITEGLGSFLDFQSRTEKGLSCAYKSIELMVHPGATSPGGLKEEALLHRDWRSQLTFPYRLGTYWDL